MASIFSPEHAPSHLSIIPELDFSDDLYADPLAGPWIRLAAHTLPTRLEKKRVEDTVNRECLLLAPDTFAAIFDRLESIGNVIATLGKPGGSLESGRGKNRYKYSPFHRFQFPFIRVTGEPLVFLHPTTSTAQLLINPDLWMFLELEEKAPGHGIWWDPRRGVDALARRVLEHDNIQVVDMRVDYLLKYLQARQMSLVIAHYRQLLLFNPPQKAIEAFVKEDVTLESRKHDAKAIFQNWGLRQEGLSRGRYLQRRLHLWYEIKPPKIDLEDPWSEKPTFDPYTFTLPTSNGDVAPARWKSLHLVKGRTFSGQSCDFMEQVYFRLDVLTKYEGASGFDIQDDGSVCCRGYWALNRSTARIGNELVCTAIGDFAEGVPFEEWPHWKQYAVEPPSLETLKALAEEPTIPDAVNLVVRALQGLNAAFAEMAIALRVSVTNPAWRGSLNSLAGRQMKWVYPANAGDDEFLKRATLASTFFLDGLQPAPLRDLLKAIGSNLHQTFENPPQSLGSRNLLKRVSLAAKVIAHLQPDLSELPILVQCAEGKLANAVQADLCDELEALNEHVRSEFAPLAFLYDLRTSGGLAHPPSPEKAGAAAAKLGLPTGNWHRTDYLFLLRILAESLQRISENLESAAEATR